MKCLWALLTFVITFVISVIFFLQTESDVTDISFTDVTFTEEGKEADVTDDVTGDVTADVTDDVTADVTADVTDDVTDDADATRVDDSEVFDVVADAKVHKIIVANITQWMDFFF